MLTLTVKVEREADGTWTASLMDQYAVMAHGNTRDEALAGVRRGTVSLMDYLKERVEIVTVAI